MKTLLSILILSTVLNISLYAQSGSLRDYRWQIGFSFVDNNPDYGGTDFNFFESPVELTSVDRELNFNITNASICDTNGELLFYTNGISICNQFGDTINNGNGLNPGWIADQDAEKGYQVPNGALVIPDPGNQNLYYLIHESLDYDSGIGVITSFSFYFTIVDMTMPEGNVITKNNLIIADTLDYGHTTAIRHANGRDWWLLKSQFNSNKFYTFMINPEGIHLSHLQEVEEPIHLVGGLSQAVFSPDGSKYARDDGSYASPHTLKLWDFDRCSGYLSNMKTVVSQDSSYGEGVAFSSNSRFLYRSFTDRVFQYDTDAADLEASEIIIAEWNEDYSPYPNAATFFMMQLAPDNKIYIAGNNSVNTLHVIHNPDEPGLACNMEKMGIDLPTFNWYSLPSFPNYRLGALAGSPCDTLGLSVDATEEIDHHPRMVTISPNPTNGVINIQCSVPLPEDAKWVLYDYQGREVFRASKSQIEAEIDLQHLADGVYIWKIFTEKDNLQTGRLVIFR